MAGAARKCILLWRFLLAVIFIDLGVANSDASEVDPIWVNSNGEITAFQDIKELRSLTLFDLVFDLQDLIWLATSDGLFCYDGYDWTRFGRTNGLPSNFIRTLTITKSGDLWVGTDQGAGIFKELRFNLIATTNLLAGPSVRRIAEDPDGTLWFCSDKWPDPNVSGGLTAYDGKNWTKYATAAGIPDEHVYQYFRDSSGRQYVLTRGGVALKEQNQWKIILKTAVWDLVETLNHQVLGFAAQTNFVFEGEKVECYPHKAPWALNSPKSLQISQQGEVLGFGLGRWKGELFESISTLNAYGLNPERIRQARDGSLWCVDTRTLIRWQNRPPPWREHLGLPTPRFVDPQGRIVFIGWETAFRQNRDKFELISELAGDIQNMLMDHLGNVWMWPQAGLIRRFREGYSDYQESQTGLNTVIGAVEDAAKNLWFYGNNSKKQPVAACFEDNQWHWGVITNSIDRELLSARADPISGIWISTIRDSSSLAFVRGQFINGAIKAERVGPSRIAGPSFVVDQQGVLYTYGLSGVFKFRMKDANWDWTLVPELKATLASDALEGPGGIWFIYSGSLGGKSGFGVYQNEQWQSVDIDMPAFVNIETTGRVVPQASSYRSADGTLFFAGYRSIHMIPPAGLSARRILTLPQGFSLPNNILRDQQGSLWLQARQQNGTNYILNFVTETNIPKTVILESTPSVKLNGIWRVRVQGVSKLKTDSETRWYQYSWRFNNQDYGPFQDFPSDGIPVGGLKPGRHRFEIRAMDECLNIQTIPTSVYFEIEPLSLQHRSWFWPLAGFIIFLIFALALLAGYRSRQLGVLNATLMAARDNIAAVNTQLQQANSELEKRVEERTTKLADTVAQLTSEIKERQRAEEQRAQIEQQMLQAQKMESLGVMAGGIAHDFNNILTAIVGNAELVEIPDDSPSQEHLDEIKNNALRAADLCQKMLAYSGKGRFVLQPVNLSTLVRNNASIIDVAISKRITVKYELAENLPSVMADEIQMRQILMSLVLNASEAIGDQTGAITIRTTLKQVQREFLEMAQQGSDLAEGAYIALVVADTGCGMNAATMNKIFDPFFSTKFTGRGLGLPAVSGIVRGHKGAIHITSLPGGGSTFTVLLPPQFVAPENRPQISPPQQTTALTSEIKGRLLLVDDEEQVLRIGAIILRRMGFDVTTARNGQDALEIVRKQKESFQYALIDLTMPQMNGIETIRELKRLQPGIQAFLASGYSEHEFTEQFALEGIAGFIQKPFSMDSLRSKMTG